MKGINLAAVCFWAGAAVIAGTFLGGVGVGATLIAAGLWDAFGPD